jgi:hypothetical protein
MRPDARVDLRELAAPVLAHSLAAYHAPSSKALGKATTGIEPV